MLVICASIYLDRLPVCDCRDVFALTCCSDEIGSENVRTCIAAEMLQVNATIPPSVLGQSAGAAVWSLRVEVYARDAVNMNYYK